MLCRLTKRSRIRAAFALIALYALLRAWLSIGGGICRQHGRATLFHGGASRSGGCSRAYAELHLASGDHVHHSVDHAHHDGMVHQPMDHSAPQPHGDGSQHKQRTGACCGVLCFTAMTNELAAPVGEAPATFSGR